jgi:hypothetical protein
MKPVPNGCLDAKKFMRSTGVALVPQFFLLPSRLRAVVLIFVSLRNEIFLLCLFNAR